MIRLSHVYKTYPGPVHALRNMDVHVEKGELVFITGPSGSGKSTLFKLICAFDKPTSGRIEVLGMDLEKIKQNEIPFLRRKIGVVFQDFKLLKGRSIFDNVALPLEVQNEKPSVISKRVSEILEMVGLRFRPTSTPEQLSGGEQQRVAIARALIHRPGILIADEPTGNLDPDLSHEIMQIFKTINAQGTTVVIASHDMGLVKKFGHKNLRIKNGEIETNPQAPSMSL
jgi:cell division transport system ATP-binding protein